MSGKNVGGRPLKTLADLPENWEKMVLAEYANCGTDAMARAYLGISNDLWYRWMSEDSKDESSQRFSEVIKRGRQLARAQFDTNVRDKLFDPEFKNWAGIIWHSRNRGWTDQHETKEKSEAKEIIIKLPDGGKGFVA